MTKQLVTPKFLTSSTPGWCLQYVDNAYNTAGRSATASAAMALAKTAGKLHTLDMTKIIAGDVQTLPNVAVPLYIALKWQPEGHIAIWDGAGKVYTSGLAAGLPTSVYSLSTFAGIMANTIPIPEKGFYYTADGTKNGTGATFIGWSEYLENTKVADVNVKTIVGAQKMNTKVQVVASATKTKFGNDLTAKAGKTGYIAMSIKMDKKQDKSIYYQLVGFVNASGSISYYNILNQDLILA